MKMPSRMPVTMILISSPALHDSLFCMAGTVENASNVSDIDAMWYVWSVPVGRQENDSAPAANGNANFTMSRASFISFEFLLM